MRYIFETFGCKTNQYETAAMRERLTLAGHEEAATPEDASVCIINTCAVTGRADATSRNAIRKLLRRNPDLTLVVTGCGVDLGESFPESPAGRTILVPNAKKHTMDAVLTGLRDEALFDVESAREDRFSMAISSFPGHTRAFLKIQDGCDNFCTYCAIPYARGVPESRLPDDVLREAARLIENGHKELVLTGINIGAYNHDGLRLAGLVGKLARTPGLGRLRLGSVEPPYVDRELVRVMAGEETVCPHIHLPLQSGDDRILGQMGRRYTMAEFTDKVGLIRDGLHLPAITTDIIVGFPGEDDASARASCQAAQDAAFSRLHVFLFSPRPGTPAAAMPRSATDRDIEGWKKQLIDIGTTLAESFAKQCVGLQERMIPEASGGGVTDRYVRVTANGIPAGDLAQITITQAAGAELQAVPIP